MESNDLKRTSHRLWDRDAHISSIQRPQTTDTCQTYGPEAFLFPSEVVPFCTKAAEHHARIRSSLEIKGLPIGPNDLIIATTVAANRGVLVTHNVKEFRRIGKLKVEDWT